MRIIFSVYTENIETEEIIKQFSELVSTELAIPEIDNQLQLFDLFHSELVVGHTLAFWDIYCYGDFYEEVINKIKQITPAEVRVKIEKDPKVLIIESFDPDNADAAFYPDINSCYFYRVSRHEHGASGFGAIIVRICSNPIVCNIISATVYDGIKYIGGLFIKTQKKSASDTKRKRMTLNAKRFYLNFCEVTNLDKYNCQMVNLEILDSGEYEVHVRTKNNEFYKVITDSRGRVRSFCLVEQCAIAKNF